MLSLLDNRRQRRKSMPARTQGRASLRTSTNAAVFFCLERAIIAMLIALCRQACSAASLSCTHAMLLGNLAALDLRPASSACEKRSQSGNAMSRQVVSPSLPEGNRTAYLPT